MKKTFGKSQCSICKKRLANNNALQKHRAATGHEADIVSKKIRLAMLTCHAVKAA